MKFKRGYWVKIDPKKNVVYGYNRKSIFRINRLYSTIAIAECLDENNHILNLCIKNLVLVKNIPVVNNLKFLAEA